MLWAKESASRGAGRWQRLAGWPAGWRTALLRSPLLGWGWAAHPHGCSELHGWVDCLGPQGHPLGCRFLGALLITRQDQRQRPAWSSAHSVHRDALACVRLNPPSGACPGSVPGAKLRRSSHDVLVVVYSQYAPAPHTSFGVGLLGAVLAAWCSCTQWLLSASWLDAPHWLPRWDSLPVFLCGASAQGRVQSELSWWCTHACFPWMLLLVML